jgi:phosphohistidine swiveling domain-containing protein
MMTDARSGILTLSDGSRLPFEWLFPGAEELTWVLDTAHFPEPFTPMGRWLEDAGRPGADRAFEEAGFPPAPRFAGVQFVGLFYYARRTPYAPEKAAKAAGLYDRALLEHGGALLFWRNFAEPRIRDVCAKFAGTSEMSLRSLAELWTYGIHQTLTSMTLLQHLYLQLVSLLTDAFGPAAPLRTQEVIQGGGNASQAIDAEIWNLAQLVREAAPLRAFFVGETTALLIGLRHERAAAAFLQRFEAMVGQHASRSEGWNIALPTWGEHPEGVLGLVRAHVAADAISPDELTRRSEARRDEARREVLERLAGDRHDEYARLIADLTNYVEIREGRAYWQMTLMGTTRLLLLRMGMRLVREGRLEDPEDILYLTGDDVEGGASDLRGLAASGRSRHEHFRKVQPPTEIGVPRSPDSPASLAETKLHGLPASRGVVTARARVLASADDGERLQDGEVLVCVMTTPNWTPLFAIAGAVVTESGAPTSHSAITAREYGIPCVVDVRGACGRIRDGDFVTVDGGMGVVTLLR